MDVTITYEGAPADEAVVVLRAGGAGSEGAPDKLTKILETDHDGE